MSNRKQIKRDEWIEKIRRDVLSAIDASVAEQLEVGEDGKPFLIVNDADLSILFPVIDRLADRLASRINDPESPVRNSAFFNIVD